MVLITWAVAIPGYALARLRFRGSETVSIGIFLTYLIPTTLLFLPLVKMIALLGLFDRLGAHRRVSNVHDPILHLAHGRLFPHHSTGDRGGGDGRRLLTHRRDSTRRAAPERRRPATVAILAFTLRMQDFVYALSFVSSSDEKVVTIGVVTELIRGDVFFWGSLMAGALLAGVRWRCCIAFSSTIS